MGVLSGLKILDFSTLLPGPFCTLKMADHGAEVICVKAKNRADMLTDVPPLLDGSSVTAAGAWLNRNKKSIYLNLKQPKSVEAIKKLIAEYDILLEQFRPGVMDRLGLGYEQLKELQPRLIYCSISGYGQTGPHALAAGHDINYLARSGNSYPTGRIESGPALMNIQVADILGGGMEAAFAILAAAYSREKTGVGQRIDVSMADGVIPLNGMEGARCITGRPVPKREGCHLNGGTLYDYYKTSDGEYMAVGSIEPQFNAALASVMGHPEWADYKTMKQHEQEVKQEYRRIFLSKTRAEWERAFETVDACVEPVRTVREALSDEHFQLRGMFPEVVLPDTGAKVRQFGTPNSLPENPVEYRHAGYPTGYHTHSVLEELGYSAEEIESEMI